MKAQKDYFYSAFFTFILPFLLLFFCGLQDYTYSALCFFFLSLQMLNFKFESCSISHIVSST